MPAKRLQVLLRARPDAPLVAGLPAAVRAAFRAGQELAPERIVIAGADAAFLRRWSFPLAASGAQVMGNGYGTSALAPEQPLLAVDADVFPDEGGLKAFAQRGGRRVLNGRAAAILLDGAASLGMDTASLADMHARALAASAVKTDAGAFFDAAAPDGAQAAAAALYARIPKDTDGYIARLDRKLSLAVTRLLLPYPVTPNQVTAASLLLGLLGAWWLAAPSAPRQLLGALILWFCCLLDGCDGEIARLKHHCTPHGAAFDLWADHAAHLATFVALPVGAARLHPGAPWLPLGILLVSGFLASGFAVWKLVLSAPEERRRPLFLVVERVASRDYVYLIVVFAALGRLDWFVWAAAVGSHVFWLWLWRQAVMNEASPAPESVGRIQAPGSSD